MTKMTRIDIKITERIGKCQEGQGGGEQELEECRKGQGQCQETEWWIREENEKRVEQYQKGEGNLVKFFQSGGKGPEKVAERCPA